MKKTLIHILMGPYDTKSDVAVFESMGITTKILTARNLGEAVDIAKKSTENDDVIIELCGAFGEEGARKIIEATQGKVGVGYVIHDSHQDHLFDSFFGKKGSKG